MFIVCFNHRIKLGNILVVFYANSAFNAYNKFPRQSNWEIIFDLYDILSIPILVSYY
jgi:hypothetical protein